MSCMQLDVMPFYLYALVSLAVNAPTQATLCICYACDAVTMHSLQYFCRIIAFANKPLFILSVSKIILDLFLSHEAFFSADLCSRISCQPPAACSAAALAQAAPLTSQQSAISSLLSATSALMVQTERISAFINRSLSHLVGCDMQSKSSTV